MENRPVIITIYYTKTTDVENSYVPIKANTYSTEEQVIGTWMDKPLYRTIYVFIAAPNTTTDYSIPDIEVVNVDFSMSLLSSSNPQRFGGSFYNPNNNAVIYTQVAGEGTTNQRLSVWYNFGTTTDGMEVTATVLYTKNTD